MNHVHGKGTNPANQDGFGASSSFEITNIPSRNRWQMERDAINAERARRLDRWMPLVLVIGVIGIVVGKLILYPGVQR